jgi:hypothetical protein
MRMGVDRAPVLHVHVQQVCYVDIDRPLCPLSIINHAHPTNRTCCTSNCAANQVVRHLSGIDSQQHAARTLVSQWFVVTIHPQDQASQVSST